MGLKSYIKYAFSGRAGIGTTLRLKRVAKGLSLFALAHELSLSVSLIEAVEAEDWHRLPKGRERTYIKLIAERLGVDLDLFAEQWGQMPGTVERVSSGHNHNFLEKLLASVVTVCSLILLLWLVVPGPNLKRPLSAPGKESIPATLPYLAAKERISLYPVAGEALPEVPVNVDGVIISIRAMDTCQATIKQCKNTSNFKDCFEEKRTLIVSEPWRLRVRGPFTIFLDNAGVVVIEVAGRRILTGCTVGESWSGHFGVNGEWLVPADKSPKPHVYTAPEADQDIVEID